MQKKMVMADWPADSRRRAIVMTMLVLCAGLISEVKMIDFISKPSRKELDMARPFSYHNYPDFSVAYETLHRLIVDYDISPTALVMAKPSLAAKARAAHWKTSAPDAKAWRADLRVRPEDDPTCVDCRRNAVVQKIAVVQPPGGQAYLKDMAENLMRISESQLTPALRAMYENPPHTKTELWLSSFDTLAPLRTKHEVALGFGRIVVSEIEVPNLLANLV